MAIEKTLSQIPKMKMDETVNLWRNAIRILEDRTKKKQHSSARVILNAIGKEWQRRYHAQVNPDGKFDWPSTYANPGSGFPDTDDWVREGVFRYMGYQVGDIAGEREAVRRRVLSEIFKGPLPPVFEPQYQDQWGQPESVARLQKMAETIASFARNGKRRRDAKMNSAIRDWENDLEFLYHEYYVGKFRFAWPSNII